MTCALFPEFEQRVNIISAGDKQTVSALYDLLERARGAGHIPGQFFAITDADDDLTSRPTHHCQWDAYHIENYLLVPQYVLSALRTLGIGQSDMADEADVLAILFKCAEETIDGLIAHRLKKQVYHVMVSSIDLEFDPKRSDVAVALTEALERSTERMQKQLSVAASKHELIDMEKQLSMRVRTCTQGRELAEDISRPRISKAVLSASAAEGPGTSLSETWC